MAKCYDKHFAILICKSEESGVRHTKIEAQKTMKATLLGKGIRLDVDVYVKDFEGNAYDIEMQMTREQALHLRSRYYHSEMDSYQIKAGQKYKDLKKSIVIFVCAFDPFEDNRSIYTFETMCKENMNWADMLYYVLR